VRPAPRSETADATVAEADVPFIEIGAPSGPVFSTGLNVLKLPAKTETPAVAERTFPRLATPKYLSVTFHDLTGRKRNEIGREGPDSGLVALHLPDHPISGEYRTLRDEIRVQLPEPTPRVLWFTAAAAEAGTTSVLLNLAITIARENSPRVLAIDGNAERPAISDRFALPRSSPGLAEVLAQQIPLAWAVHASTLPNLQVLPLGTATTASAELIGQDMAKLIGQLRQWYDWVLIDSGIWGSMPQRDSVCPSADAVYLVSREADVERTEFAGVRGWVKELGGLLRGYVATKV
jgi:Mrp family chromosome partitioning ATPase